VTLMSSRQSRVWIHYIGDIITLDDVVPPYIGLTFVIKMNEKHSRNCNVLFTVGL